MPKTEKSALTWADVFTNTQRDGLIRLVLVEIAKLRYSPALRDIVDSNLTLSKIGTYHVLHMYRQGEIREEKLGKSWDEWKTISEDELPEKIAQYGILPAHVSEIRKRMER